MPTEIETVDWGYRRRFFSSAELKAIGLDGAQCPEEWESDQIVDIESSQDSHGTAVLVTFKYEDAFWQVSVGHHHEDWSGTNDLVERSRLEAYEATPYTKTLYRRRES